MTGIAGAGSTDDYRGGNAGLNSYGQEGLSNSNSLQDNVLQLHGKNYKKWSQTIRLNLQSKGKYGFLMGEHLTVKGVWEVVKETYFVVQNSSQFFDFKSRLWHAKQGAKNVIIDS